MFRSCSTYICSVVLLSAMAVSGLAQTDPAAPNAPQAEAAPNASKFPSTLPAIGPVKLSGLFDGYYSYNFNDPASRFNTWRNFDTRDNYPAINMGILSADMAPAPVGFKFAIGLGHAFDIFHATEPGHHDAYKYIYQAYVSVKPASMKGFQVDFGKFVTSAGAEVTETNQDWNYSRSLLYANGPYYHTGFRTTMPITKTFSAGFQLIQGWNSVEDNNSGKTMGFTTALNTSKVTWTNAYYAGPEKAYTNEGWRHFFDTVVVVNSAGKVSWLFNFDYGQENVPNAPASKFYGLSTAAKFAVGKNMQFSPRYDWYRDRDGFITTVAQTMQEFTATYDFKVKDNFITRFEFRDDWSDRPFYDNAQGPGLAKRMPTVLVGLLFSLGPKQ